MTDQHKTVSRRKVRLASLTRQMVATLLAHAEGPRPTHAVVMELRVLQSLKRLGLIRFNRFNRPTHSIATTRGRSVIAEMLDDKTTGVVTAKGAGSALMQRPPSRGRTRIELQTSRLS